MIENTSSRDSLDLTAMLVVATGDTAAIIGAQEKAGQSQVVHSDRLPSKLCSPRADFETLGFSFGEPDPADPMFAPATLPEGWSKQGSDHDMWSYVVDQLGRRRAGVFYKAAFYDRKADMHLINVSGYVAECTYEGREIVTDDVWATREAVAEAARERAAQAQERVDDWEQIAERSGADEMSSKYIAEYGAERDKYTALAEKYTA